MTTATTRRFPARLYSVGSAPDPRFTLANERTFLAWIRTSLAWTAGGVALEALGQGLQPELRLAAAVVLIAAGIVTALQAWWGWIHTERALRRQTPLPSPGLALPVGVAVVVVGVRRSGRCPGAAPFLGPTGLVIAGAGVIASLSILVLAHRRYRTHHHRLTSGHFEHLGLPDGALPALLTGTALTAGIIGIALTATL